MADENILMGQIVFSLHYIQLFQIYIWGAKHLSVLFSEAGLKMNGFTMIMLLIIILRTCMFVLSLKNLLVHHSNGLH
jgi:hypothetical protein